MNEEIWTKEFKIQVRKMGETLIKNAKSIVGSQEGLKSFIIHIEFEKDRTPEMVVTKKYRPSICSPEKDKPKLLYNGCKYNYRKDDSYGRN